VRPARKGGQANGISHEANFISTFPVTNSHNEWTKKRGAAHSTSGCNSNFTSTSGAQMQEVCRRCPIRASWAFLTRREE